MASGGSIPLVGLGTRRSQQDRDLEAALDAAREAGYRYFDTSLWHDNEHVIGRVLNRWMQEGKVKREELFIATKLPLNAMRASDVAVFLNGSLSRLQLDYVDLYLVHFPVGVLRDGLDQNGNVKPGGWDMTTNHFAIWKAMEDEHMAGRVKALGVSNFNETQIERIMSRARVPVSNVQVELHLRHQQKPLVEFCRCNNISVTAYAPLGSPSMKWMFRGKELPDLFSLQTVKDIAARHKKTAAQVLLRHTTQQGIVVIPKSFNPQRIQENIDIFDFTLTDQEVAMLDALDLGLAGKLFTMTNFASHPEYPWRALI